MFSRSAGKKPAFSESESSPTSDEDCKNQRLQHGSATSTPCILTDTVGNPDPRLEQEKHETSGAGIQPQHGPSVLDLAMHTGGNEEIVVTSVRATDVTLGLRRVPAGFYAAIRHGGLEWRSENKSLSVNTDVVEWTGPIAISLALLAPISLEVYASFELQPTLGTGEQLRKVTITVEQLLSRSTRNLSFTFFPKDGDVVSPCSSISVTVQRQDHEKSRSSTSMVLRPHRSTTNFLGKLECTTNEGHSALSRYRKHGERQDLEQSVKAFERAFSICPVGHPCRAAAQSNLAMAQFIFCQAQDTDTLLPLRLYRDALAVRPVGHVDRPSTLIQLAMVHLARFEKSGDGVEGANAERLLREATELSSAGGHDGRAAMFLLRLSAARRVGAMQPKSLAAPETDTTSFLTAEDLGILSVRLLERFEQFGDLVDLEEAIAILQGLVRLGSLWDEGYQANLGNLGAALTTRFEYLGKLDDLEDAISTLKQAIGLTTCGHPRDFTYAHNLGTSLLARFWRLGELRDLEEAISTFRNILDLAPRSFPDMCLLLGNLGISLVTRFRHIGELKDLEDAISTFRNALDLTPHSHANRPYCLNNLANSLSTRFERLGELKDLEGAISLHRDAVDLTPDDHRLKFIYVNNLGDSILIRFRHLGEPRDLEETIVMFKTTVNLTPHGHLDMPIHLSNLGKSFLARFKHYGELRDLEDAMSVLKDAIDLLSHGHPDKRVHLNYLSNCFLARFDRLGELRDLEDAISMLTDAVNLTPHGHPCKYIYLNNLGSSLTIRFRCLREPSDLNDAILALRDAIELTPHGHFNRPSYLRNLGASFRTRFEYLGEPRDLEVAISLYSHAASAPFGPIEVRFGASQDWVSCARFIRHHTLLRAYSVTIDLLPQLAWIGLSLAHRYSRLTEGANVVREAAAAALDAELPETAVEWLERGRSVVWGELFQLRSSYEELFSAFPSHARRLRELSAALESANATHEEYLSGLSECTRSVVNLAPESSQQQAHRHRMLAIERDKLVQEIRRLPGFEGFLRYKQFSHLRASAHAGPVVILNAAESRCDALVVLSDLDHVIHVPLPKFTFKRSAGLQDMLEKLLGHARTTRVDERVGQAATVGGVSWGSLLSALWKDVVKHVLDGLAFSSPGNLSRIFWCPTGPFTFLPIHAAGLYDVHHSQPGHKVFDFIISSYVPTLAILIPSPSPAVVPSDNLRLLVVRQPASDGLSQLPGVVTELGRIRGVIKSSPSPNTTLLETSAGTVEEVLEMMKVADWVHFACHGIQDGVDSGLCLANGRRLRVRDIITLSRPRGGLAFLSACQTAMGDEHLSDEAIHVAAGMLFAGYEGVVGTMWSISDKLAPDVARDVYGQLLRSGTRPDHREAARALHEAIGRVRDGGRGSFVTWLPFIHVGL